MGSEPPTTLARTLTLPMLTMYGLGTMVGAGIYVLIGEVAGRAGLYAPMSFLVAALIACFTGLSYAELSSHLPRSAGEATYVRHAFNRRSLATLTGLAVVATGIVSAATIANGFVGYLAVFIDAPGRLVITVFVFSLGLMAAWGITQSVWVAITITALSVAGLVLVIVIAGGAASEAADPWASLIPPLSLEVWTGVTLGAFIAFYAFIGFEDMVNVAEEVKDPRHNLPIGILLALLLASILYVLVASVAVLAVPVERLANSDAPLVEVVASRGVPGELIAGLSLLSVTNSALAQIIMAARILYGLSAAGSIPAVYGRVNESTRTPVVSTAVISAAVLAFALWLPLVTLAEITSFVIVTVFALINVSLVRIKLVRPPAADGIVFPLWAPIIGTVLCLFLLVTEVWSKLGCH